MKQFANSPERFISESVKKCEEYVQLGVNKNDNVLIQRQLIIKFGSFKKSKPNIIVLIINE